MKIFSDKKKEQLKKDFTAFLANIRNEESAVESKVKKILEQVKSGRNEALIEYSNLFDKTNFNSSQDFLVSDEEFVEAEKILDQSLKNALNHAAKRILSYHQKQLPQDLDFVDEDGVRLGNLWKAIESIGIYVPGGTASYPSSVLMSAIPAIAAKVENISICTPPNKDGKVAPAILYAAKLCNVKKIYKLGGAQAIAAMAYGTESVAKVDKIVGPGNSFVALAKKLIFGAVGIDMIAGPTDLTIVAQNDSNPAWIATDAISQLEHGPDSKIFVITNDLDFANSVKNKITELSVDLPRAEIIKSAILNSAILVLENLDDAAEFVNLIAPEHLEIISSSQDELMKKIKNAGAIFLGNYTPEAIGDYIAGPSHTLPTGGTAKFSSGLSVYDFLKRISLISCNKKSFKNLSKDAMIIAHYEGLDGHKLSMKIRNDEN